jgi:hypothetical protein
MLPAYPGIPILISFPVLSSAQGTVAAKSHADAAVIAPVIEGYLVFVG